MKAQVLDNDAFQRSLENWCHDEDGHVVRGIVRCRYFYISGNEAAFHCLMDEDSFIISVIGRDMRCPDPPAETRRLFLPTLEIMSYYFTLLEAFC